MKIGDLARAVGTTVKTIRFYEDAGLIRAAPRTESGYRIYEKADVERLGFIRSAKRLGMSLEEIRGVLQLHDLNEPTCVHVRALLDDKIARIELALKELRDFRRDLASLRDKAGDLEDCCPTGGNICGIVERSEVTLDEASLTWLGSHWPRRS
ncbi:MAG: heavy metal-responsive transcriptional regulator [Chloroflexi bacterium]|nr:heavy metal-responsive transcriptional regulator [Chloroflexota bacterium]